MTAPEVARLESERLRPVPPGPGPADLLTDLIGVLYEACRQADPELPAPRPNRGRRDAAHGA